MCAGFYNGGVPLLSSNRPTHMAHSAPDHRFAATAVRKAPYGKKTPLPLFQSRVLAEFLSSLGVYDLIPIRDGQDLVM
jgi:hypothetical protein